VLTLPIENINYSGNSILFAFCHRFSPRYLHAYSLNNFVFLRFLSAVFPLVFGLDSYDFQGKHPFKDKKQIYS